jgi:hypothetical protein
VGEAPRAFPTLLSSRRARLGIAAIVLLAVFAVVSRAPFLNADTRGLDRKDVEAYVESRYAPAHVLEMHRVSAERHEGCLVGFFEVHTDRGDYWVMDNPLLGRPATPAAMGALRDAHARVVRCS